MNVERLKISMPNKWRDCGEDVQLMVVGSTRLGSEGLEGGAIREL